jgi:hypothetical protein
MPDTTKNTPPNKSDELLPPAIEDPGAPRETVRFIELPLLVNKLSGGPRTDEPPLKLPANPLQKVEAVHRRIAAIPEVGGRDSEEQLIHGKNDPGTTTPGDIELSQVISEKTQGTRTLQIVIPSKSAISSTAMIVGEFRIKDNQLTFRWNDDVAKRHLRSDPERERANAGRRLVSDLVRDSVIRLQFEKDDDWYLLLRDPKPVSTAIQLQSGVWNQSLKRFITTSTWTTKDLADCDWDLVVTDWTIVSSLNGSRRALFGFKRSDHGKAGPALSDDLIQGELSFNVSISKEKLVAQFDLSDTLEKLKNNATSQLNETEKKLETVVAAIERNDKTPLDEKSKESIDHLRDQLKKLENERVQYVREVQEAKLKERKYMHFEKPAQAFLHVGIGLRLSNGKVIEIARIGQRWKPAP